MGQAIGDSIPFAVGVAVCPLPIITVVLMLLSTRAGPNSLAFGFGWIAGVTGALTVVILASGTIGTGSDDSPSSGTSTVKLILGILVLVAGQRDWRKRPKPGETAELPKWLKAIESTTPVKSAGLGILLSALNPKSLLLIVGGGLAIAGAPTTSGGKTVAAVVFVILGVSTVVIPIVLYRVLGTRAQRTLESLNVWLQANNAVVMSVLLLVIGVVLIGKGVGGF